MAYRTFVAHPSPEQGARRANARVVAINNRVQSVRDASLNGLTADVLLDLVEFLRDGEDEFNAVAAIPGIREAIRDHFPDQPLYEPVTELQAVRLQTTALADWIETQMPATGAGWLNVTMFIGGRLSYRQFDAATLEGFRTEADALLALID